MTVACIANTCTIELDQDGSGTLTATLLAKGFGYIGATGAQLLIDTVGTTGGSITAPATGSVVAGTVSEQKIHNDRCYKMAFMGLQFAQVTDAFVPAGEVWTVEMQSSINGASFAQVAQQIYDNGGGAAGHNFSGGPMIVPFSTELNPGDDIDVQIRVWLVRSGAGSGTINVGQVEMRHFVCWPAL